MSLVQVNAMRELLEDVKQRLASLDTTQFSPPAVAAIKRASGFSDKSIAALARAEQFLAKVIADTGGDSDGDGDAARHDTGFETRRLVE